MATLTNVITNTVIGDLRMRTLNWTAAGTAEAADLGMGVIHDAQVSVMSQASFVNSGSTQNMARVAINVGVSGTAIVGSLALTSTISGDVYKVVVYAKS